MAYRRPTRKMASTPNFFCQLSFSCATTPIGRARRMKSAMILGMTRPSWEGTTATVQTPVSGGGFSYCSQKKVIGRLSKCN